MSKQDSGSTSYAFYNVDRSVGYLCNNFAGKFTIMDRRNLAELSV